MAKHEDADDRENAEDAGRSDDGHQYVDRSIIDFDPADGHYTGTAVDGTSEIPGPHERGEDGGDDVGQGEERQAAAATDGDSAQ